MQNKKTQRNGIIEFLRFIASLSILVYHFELIYLERSIHFMHLYIWVEFFFIISGFFLAKNINNKESAIEYTWKQIKKLYPIYLLGFIATFIVTNIFFHTTLKGLLISLWKTKFEIFLINIFSLDPYTNLINLGGGSSYIGALLIGTLFVYYMIQNHKKVFQNLAPIFILCGYCLLLNTFGNLSQWAHLITIPSGIIRAICGLSVGAFLYLTLNDKFKKLGNTKNSMIVIVSLFVAVGLIVFKNSINSFDLVFYVVIFGMMIASSYNIKIPYVSNTFVGIGLLNKICIYLGNLSYPIFIFHYVVIFYFKNFLSPMSYKIELIAVSFCTIILAMLILFIQNKIIPMMKSKKKTV